jgi:hypothetical protein
VEQPRYVLHEAVGVGGMGVVYRGTLVSPAGERAVAIKQLAERGRIDPRRRERLIAEARLVFRLTHANICQVLDLGESDRGTFVVMELVRGCDLRALQEQLSVKRMHLDAACALYVAREVARGLDFAHRFRAEDGTPLGLVHGDVTPQNVLISVEGEVKLADFGIAHALDAAAPGAGLMAGTPGFVAPELKQGQRDHRADIYTLGVTLLVTLTHLPPSYAVEALPRLCTMRTDVTDALQQILARATATRPEQRYASAAELERELSTELARRHPTFTPSVLAEVVRAHAPERRGERRGLGTLRSMTMVETRPWAPVDTEPPVAAMASSPAAPGPKAATRTAHTDAAPLAARARIAAVSVLALAGLGLVAWRMHVHARTPAMRATPSLVTATPAAELTPPPLPAPPPSPLPAPPPSPPVAAPTPPAYARGHACAPTPPAATGERARGAAHAVAVRRHPTPVAGALINVNANPWGAVLVDGHQIAPETPLYRHALPAGDHVVMVRFADGKKSAPQHVHLSPGELRTLGFAR